jgi:hypothetical protein
MTYKYNRILWKDSSFQDIKYVIGLKFAHTIYNVFIHWPIKKSWDLRGRDQKWSFITPKPGLWSFKQR